MVIKRLDSTEVGYSVAKNGTALVEVEIVRPEQPTEDMPDLSLARANTSVTWAAPELVLESLGPDRLSPGQQSQYVIKVYNVGSMPADNLSLTMTLPNALFQIVNSSFPPSRQTNQALIWDNVGRLEPRSEITITVNVAAMAAGDAKVIFDLIASPNIKQQKTIDTSVVGDSLSLSLAPKPDMSRVPINNQVIFDCVLVNNSGRALSNVNVQLQSTSGIVHAESGETLVRREIASIPAGERVVLEPIFIVRAPGEHRLNATVSVAGNVLANAVAVVEGLNNAAPISPPSSGSVLPDGGMGGANGPATPVLPPSGSTPPPIVPPGGIAPPPSLPSPPVLPEGNNPPSGGGGSGFPGLPPLPGAVGGQSSARPAIGSGVANSDRLSVSIQPLQQAISRGDKVTYEIRVDNLTQQPDSRVVIAFAVPKGGTLISVRAQGLEHRLLSGGSIVELTPIQFFRARDSFAFQFQIQHGDSPSQSIVASAKSQNQPTAVSNSINVRVQ